MSQTPRLEVGDKAPAFSLADADGNAVKLSDYKGRKVIVYFYPAASTPGCTKEACDFRDNLAELNDAGLDVVGLTAAFGAMLALAIFEERVLTSRRNSCRRKSSRLPTGSELDRNDRNWVM